MTEYFSLLYEFINSNNRILMTGKNITEMFTDIFYLEIRNV